MLVRCGSGKETYSVICLGLKHGSAIAVWKLPTGEQNFTVWIK